MNSGAPSIIFKHVALELLSFAGSKSAQVHRTLQNAQMKMGKLNLPYSLSPQTIYTVPLWKERQIRQCEFNGSQ